MRRQIIEQIKSELHMLEVSSLPNEFEKHLYAIETLVGVLKEEGPANSGSTVTTGPQIEPEKPAMTENDKRMLELMGGSQKKDKTPEDKKNNDSIFDF